MSLFQTLAEPRTSFLLPPVHAGSTCVILPMRTSSRWRRKPLVANELSLVQVRLPCPPSDDQATYSSPGLWKWQDFSRRTSFCTPFYSSPNFVVDAANAISPPPTLKTGGLPKGNPGAGTGHPNTVHLLYYDTTKAARILGLKYRTIAETTRDTLEDYQAKGW